MYRKRLKQRIMAAVKIEIKGISPFECKGNSSALAPRWKKWLQSFQYFILAKGVVNDVQKKALLFHTAGIEVQELYETLTHPGTDTFGEDTRGGGGTPLNGLYRYVPRNRVWFLEVLDP